MIEMKQKHDFIHCYGSFLQLTSEDCWLEKLNETSQLTVN